MIAALVFTQPLPFRVLTARARGFRQKQRQTFKNLCARCSGLKVRFRFVDSINITQLATKTLNDNDDQSHANEIGSKVCENVLSARQKDLLFRLLKPPLSCTSLMHVSTLNCWVLRSFSAGK